MVHMSKEPMVARSQHHCMTILFHSGTLCPVIGSECVLSAVSLQDVMKTFVRLTCAFVCHVMNQINTARMQICAAPVMFFCIYMYVRGIVLCFCIILLEMGIFF